MNYKRLTAAVGSKPSSILTRRTGCALAIVLLCLAAFPHPAVANQVLSWGRNYYGQTDVPPGLSDVVSVSAGYQHCLALKSDGNVVAWGQNTNAQLNIPASVTNNVVAIAAGWYHSLALLNDGSVVGWGAGVTNTGADHDYGQCIIPPNVTNVLSIAAGRYFSMALLSDRTVAVWGENFYGQTNIPAGLTNVAAIAADGMHCMALKDDGTIVAWGGNGSGELNIPAGLTNVAAIFAANYNSYAIKTDGSVVVWGDNFSAQSTVPAGVSNVVMAAGGSYYSMAIKDTGIPVAWGNADSTLPSGMTNVISMTGGFYMGLAVTNDGSPVVTAQPPNRRTFSGNFTALRALVPGAPPMNYQWSFNGVPIPDATNAALPLASVQMTNAGDYSFIASNSFGVVSSSNATLTVVQQAPILTAEPKSVVSYRFGPATFTSSAIGSLPMTFQWQLNGTNLPNATNTTLSLTNALPRQAGNYSVVVSNEFGVATSTNATLILLQVRDNGNSTYNSSQYSVPLSLTNDVQAIAAGTFHSLVLKSNGTLVTWGTTLNNLQIIPASATNVIAVAAGGYNSLVLRSNGTVVEWGDGYSGQTNIPPGLSNVVAISVGDAHSLALRQNGTVVSWGSNTSGQTNVPASATNIIAIAAGGAHSLALRSNGTLIAWGNNTIQQTNIPANATNVAAIAAAGNHNFILKKDGSTFAWGNASQTFLPNTNIVAIGTGGYSGSYFSILRGDGTVSGGFVAGTSNAVAIATGGTHNLVLLGDGSPVTYWPPYSFPAARPGDTVTTRVNVSGTGPITYQWQLNGTNIVGATNASLTLTNIPITMAGVYRCVISNADGTVISGETTLSITRYPLLFSTSTNLIQMTTNGFKMRVTGLAGAGPLIVYTSTNMLDWLPTLTNPPVVGTFDLLDPDGTVEPQSFYKVSEGP